MYNFFMMIFGCLKIRLTGSGIEKLLTEAAKKRIPIRNLRYKNMAVTGSIQPKYFLKLKNARKGIDVKIKIIKKSGIIFKLYPHRKRVGFILGFLIFLSLLKFLSLFVWGVSVEGNKTVSTSQIIAVCESLGIKNGVSQNSLDPKTLADKILLEIPNLTWASVNIEGCYVTVNVSEAERTDEYRQKPPSNLLAENSGTVIQIDTVSGDTLVNIGDAVAKGDILVSGIIEAKGTRSFVSSEGKIIAEVQKTYAVTKKFKDFRYVETKRDKRRVLTALWLDIPLYLGKTKPPYSYKSETKELSFLGKKIPVAVTTGEFILKKRIEVKYSRENLEKMLTKEIDNNIKRENEQEYAVVSAEFTETADGLTLTKTIKTTENIAKQVPIHIE